MSLGVVIKGPEGVVLAADSRVTLKAQREGGPPMPVNFDNATKLLSFERPHNFVAAVTYGDAVIGLRTAHSFIPEFELTLKGEDRLKVHEFARKLSNFFLERWREANKHIETPQDYSGSGMVFVVGGYDPDAAYGSVFLFQIPQEPELSPRNPGENDFGITWGGQLEVGSRLIQGYDPALVDVLRQTLNLDEQKTNELLQQFRMRLGFQIPYQVLPLQDCVDLATFLIRSTITLQRLAVGLRGVGGPIEVAIITRTGGLEYIQRKEIRGEDRT